jgi:hypothetical protein
MNFFLELYNQLAKMNMNGKDLDHLLDSLPWKQKEIKEDGTIVYECSIQNVKGIKTNE